MKSRYGFRVASYGLRIPGQRLASGGRQWSILPHDG